uniref:glycerol-3-phosphate phosphatase isoform X1 n=1 Tax=Macaca mulatta TaxID=9544 RepID=UPI0010A2A647|nr:glycerol-3-phosphate phosphatase isoform X1 [Macaca mulatta]
MAAAAEAGGDDARCVRLSAERAQALLADVDTLLFDCDGVLWRGETAVPGAPEALRALRARGKRLGFITNNSSKTRAAYAEKLRRLGFGGPAGPGAGLEVFGTAYCTALYLSQRLAGAPAPKAYVLGSPALAAELEAVGVTSVGVGPEPLQGEGPGDWLHAPLEPDVRAVVVGFDPHFSYMKLTKALRYLQQPDCLLVGTNMDNRLPLENGRFIVPAVWSEPWRWPPSARPTSSGSPAASSSTACPRNTASTPSAPSWWETAWTQTSS